MLHSHLAQDWYRAGHGMVVSDGMECGGTHGFIHRSLDDMTANMTNSSLVQAVWGLGFTGQTTPI